MSVVILQDEIVHYEVLGRGRPLIFLHGWCGSWRYWIPAMQATSVMFRSYALDFWGFGDSAKDPSKYSIQQQSTLLLDFMDKLGIAKTALVGHGLGGMVGTCFASTYTEKVDRIMAVSLPLGEDLINPKLSASSPGELADWLLARTPSSEPARLEAPKTDVQAVTISLLDISNLHLLDLWSSLNNSCLFVHGQNDPAILAPTVEILDKMPEYTHQILFEQSGHFPMLDESSKFNRLLADFLALPSGESPRQLQLKEEWKRRVR